MLSTLDVKRQQRYHMRWLGFLPAKYESEDSNKISILYFSLCSLSLLGDLPLTKNERSDLVRLIYDQMVVTDEYCAFVPSNTMFPVGTSLSATCFALQCLLILEDDLKGIHLNKMKQFVLDCQSTNGGFSNSPNDFGGVDLRFAMLATTILTLIKCCGINTKKLYAHIQSIKSYDGGYSNYEGGESHAGLTFCAIDALSLSSNLAEDINVLEFLVHRQISHCREEIESNEYADEEDQGGFNGRWNKYGDTCYVFWCVASLALMNKIELIDKDLAIEFLLRKTQNIVLGGFNKTTDPDDFPDPYHSFLGLASLSLLTNGEGNLAKFDPELVIPVHVRKHWESLTI